MLDERQIDPSESRRIARQAERRRLAIRRQLRKRTESRLRARQRFIERSRQKAADHFASATSERNRQRTAPKTGCPKHPGHAHTARPTKLRPVSPKRAKENVEYERNVREWNQRSDKRCEFVGPDGVRCERPAAERPHHVSGRATRELRVNRKYFRGLCWWPHHRWVDTHRKEAEKLDPPMFIRVF